MLMKILFPWPVPNPFLVFLFYSSAVNYTGLWDVILVAVGYSLLDGFLYGRGR